ncbi:MAG: hypothetical protein OXR67_17590 [Chloroflexota bacterium]|nr:hypothetical protein [Chloroflexota bacterium]
MHPYLTPSQHHFNPIILVCLRRILPPHRRGKIEGNVDQWGDNYLFLAYYPGVAAFAVVSSLFSLVLAWTAVVAAVYVGVCVQVGPGLDLGAGAGISWPDGCRRCI